MAVTPIVGPLMGDRDQRQEHVMAGGRHTSGRKIAVVLVGMLFSFTGYSTGYSTGHVTGYATGYVQTAGGVVSGQRGDGTTVSDTGKRPCEIPGSKLDCHITTVWDGIVD
jgi:hypothetical protein